jgi:hypothetical protein
VPFSVDHSAARAFAGSRRHPARDLVAGHAVPVSSDPEDNLLGRRFLRAAK